MQMTACGYGGLIVIHLFGQVDGAPARNDHILRYNEALSGLGNVTHPRLSELVYRVAASACVGDAVTLEKHTNALREAPSS
jgi:hypothetical protein